MIRVAVTIGKDRIKKMSISGHAGYDGYGKDLVCAAVSAIGFGLCNALDELDGNCICKISDDQIDIETDGSSDQAELILRTGIIQLRTIEEQFRKNIEIKTTEV